MESTRVDERAADAAWRRWVLACKNLSAAEHEGLPAALLQQLAAHERIIGVKDSSGDPKSVAAYREAVPDWTVVVGGASLLLTALELGCQGGIIGVSCYAPGLCVQLVREFTNGNRTAASALRRRLKTKLARANIPIQNAIAATTAY